MTPQEMANEILGYIRKNGDASFANIMDLFGDEAKGEWAKEALPNLVLWAGMSSSLIEALNIIQPQTELKPCHLLVYLADGRLLQMPIAKRHPKTGYAEPHWLPTVLVLRKAMAGSRKPEAN